MRNPFRNLRVPGTKPNPYPRGRVRSAGSRPLPGRGLPGRREPARAWALGPAERTRSRPRTARRLPWRRIGLALGGIAAAALLSYGGAWLLTSDALRVRQVDVVGARVVTAQEVAAVAGVGGSSMPWLDLGGVEAAVEALPAVKSAVVTREWPQGVRIQLEEHQAWGYWQVAGHVLVIDADGLVLQASRPAPEDAPTILEVAAPRDLREGTVGDPDTVRLVARLLAEGVFERNGIRTTGFLFQRERGLTVIADGAPAAVFGDSSNYEFKVQALEAVLSRLRSSDAGPPQVAEIDLRFGRNVVMR